MNRLGGILGIFTIAAFVASLTIAVTFRTATTAGRTIPLWIPIIYVTGILLYLLLHSSFVMGVKTAGAFLCTALSVSLLFEHLGVKYGFLFGTYEYTGGLGPKLFGTVSLAIPGLWFGMCYGAYSLVALAIGYHPRNAGSPLRLAIFILMAAHATTAWDLAADQVAVSFGFWIWPNGGAFFGIPLSNYLGWFITATVIFTISGLVEHRLPGPDPTSGHRWLRLVPAGGYLCGVANHCLACTQIGKSGAALAAVMAVVPLLLLAILRLPDIQRRRNMHG